MLTSFHQNTEINDADIVYAIFHQFFFYVEFSFQNNIKSNLGQIITFSLVSVFHKSIGWIYFYKRLSSISTISWLLLDFPLFQLFL